MITARIKVIRGKDRQEIYNSVSRDKRTNKVVYRTIVGDLIDVEGYLTEDGVDISNELVRAKVCTSVLMSDEIGRQVIRSINQEFRNRQEVGDRNNVVEVVVEASRLDIPGNIIIKGVKRAYVSNKKSVQVNTAKDVLYNLRRAEIEQANTKPGLISMMRHTAPRVGKFIKEYF